MIGLGNRLGVFQNELVDKITKYNEIDLELPGRKPCAYFCIISDQDSSLEFLSSLFFSTLFVRLTNYARRHGDNGRLPVKVNVCLDEFCNIGKILDFKKIISTVRSRGINCQVIIQSAAQLSDRYEKKEWEEIVGNCDTSLFLGCNDTMTAEYISGKCGMATIKTTNDSMPLTPLFSPVINSTKPYSQTRSNTQRALMLPDEVLRLPNNQCLVLLRGQKPLQLYKIIPDELPAFHKLTPVKISDFIPDWKKQENEKNSKLRKKSISEGPKEASVNKEKEKEKNSLIQELFEMPRQADNKAESSTGLALHYDNVAEKNKEESIHNGWINDNGEVFVIYTRKELSDCLNISEKRVTAAMHELGAIALIWERRCGRGFANQIYLANVRISDYDAKQSKGAPLDESPTCEELRTDDTACLDVEATEIYCTISNEPVGKPVDNSHDIVDKSTIMASSKPIDIQNTGQELSVGNFKNCQYSGFRTAVSSVQEPPKLPPNNKEKDLKPAYVNQSQSKSCPSVATEEIKTCTTDTDILDRLMQLAGVDVLPEKDGNVIKDAIERLYYMQSIKIGNAVYPTERIRSHLWRLNFSIIQDAIFKITKNTNKIRNSSAYVITVLFNTIMETESDLIVDPYLNFLRNRPKKDTSVTGGD